ncbi:GrpB family protein [Streptomyces sp. NPDC050418]|uniref:GrpB family protein n=1 Tax=Streptomyces sp. NPDC050418 TaxID=3365612 RepID=UPI0037A247B8
MPFPDEAGPVAVVDHRPQWAADYTRLAGVLRDALGDRALAVDHVGSTSVPGLAAKDCIDVQVLVERIDEDAQTALMAGIGFRCRPEPWNRSEVSSGLHLPKLVFAPPVGARRCNVHLRVAGGAGARFALLFRDYLRADETAREAWGAFKQRLAVSVTDAPDYGQIKVPATVVLMGAAERWAAAAGWEVAPAWCA